MKEIGRIGQKRNGGHFYEEFIRDLRGRKGIEVYYEMSENDDLVGAILFALDKLIRQVRWTVTPAGNTKKDKEAAEFIESCLYDMQSTWTDTISEILTFLTYGWSFHEIVYKRRMGRKKNQKLNSRYNDGLIGWMKLPIRSQGSLYQWEYDMEDNLLGMTQMPAPNYNLYTIPMEKALLFRTQNRKDNPEGKSILRNAYRSWYFKRRIQEIEGIGIERDLAGLPVIYGPEDMNIWDDEDEGARQLRDYLESLVKSIRRDELEGVVLPGNVKLELLSSGGKRQFDTNAIIGRYDTGIAMSILADFLLLGHQQVGSWALSSDKTELFAMAAGTFLDIICETFNRKAIPDLIDINGEHFHGITDYPELCHGDIEKAEFEKIGTFIKDMTGVGILVPDQALEDYVREMVDLPPRDNKENGTDNHIDTTSGKEIMDDEIEAAKKRLGRV